MSDKYIITYSGELNRNTRSEIERMLEELNQKDYRYIIMPQEWFKQLKIYRINPKFLKNNHA